MIPGLSKMPGWFAATGGAPTGINKIGESTFTVASGSGAENKTLPGSILENDIVIVMLSCNARLENSGGKGGTNTTSSYTNIFLSSGGAPGMEVAYKRMSATPDTTVSIHQQSANLQTGIIQVWRLVNTTTAIDAIATTANAGPGLPNPPSYTSVTNDALRIVTGHLDQDDAASGVTAPSGYTDLAANDTGQASTSVGATVMVASKIAASAGAEDPAAFAGSAGTDNWIAVHFALRPV